MTESGMTSSMSGSSTAGGDSGGGNGSGDSVATGEGLIFLSKSFYILSLIIA